MYIICSLDWIFIIIHGTLLFFLQAADGRTIPLHDEEERLRQEISPSKQLENSDGKYLQVGDREWQLTKRTPIFFSEIELKKTFLTALLAMFFL